MSMTWVERQVRNTSLRQLGACLLLFHFAAFHTLDNAQRLGSYARGVAAMSQDQLRAVTSVSQLSHDWVALQADKVVSTGVYSRQKYDQAIFSVAQLGDRLLLIKADPTRVLDASALSGGLVAADMQTIDLISRLATRSGDAGAVFLPVMLDTEKYTSPAMAAVLFLFAVPLVLVVLIGRRALPRLSVPSSHPDLRAVRGQSADALDMLSARLQHDVVTARSALKLRGQVRVTDTHVLQRGWFRFRLMPLSDMLYAYSMTTTTLMFGVIPTHRSHSLMFYFSNQKMRAPVRKAQTAEVMQHLARVAPWVLLGHARELDRAYKKDRSRLIELVAARRRLVAAGQS
ncbi:DUF6709 family protein [Bradyrhizobium sp. GCM10027634]|uniref:DUF6709 family protein n=1 Tax=unclassified Bradyrhizobium TaxID=2631580 RepID=UPI00188CC108|nr:MULTISPECIES: hypothetical protein [unclassified Bradyrhizobium]MDN5000480.1 hypothetical protein [Bradyrhizobium sp. WYCCWR 12677]